MGGKEKAERWLRYRVRDAAKKTGWRIKTEMLEDCTAKKAALTALEDKMKQINGANNGITAPESTMMFSEFASKLWLEYLDNKGVKPSTRYSYEAMLKHHLLPELGDMELSDVKPVHVTNLLSRLKREGYSPHYRLNLYAILRTMFELALEYDLVSTNPVRRKLHRPKLEPVQKPTLAAEEIGRISQKVPERWKTLFLFLALTGVRAGELLGLRWQDVDWMAKIVTVRHSLWRDKLVSSKTEKSVRILPMPKELHDALFAHRRMSAFTEPDNFIFCKEDGSPCDPNELRKEVLYPAMDAAEIKRLPRMHGFHLFRHSAATIVHAQTHNLKLAQELLGHARLSTTADIYVHSDAEAAKEATETLAKAITPYCSLTAHQIEPGSDQIQ